MSSDWDEIRRLAADFQKLQLSSTLHKLSERNCVEIVTLLAEKGYIDVIYTNDGKEYITPQHLEKETLDELYLHEGRVNLVTLSKIFNVDLSKINLIAEKIDKENDHIHFMLGQLIDEDYITKIAIEINEKLSQNGEIKISDLTIQYDLPSDFLQHDVVEKHLGKIIRGRQDPSNPRVFFTQNYILRCKAKIRGALSAIMQPTLVSTILQHIQMQEKIFYSVLDEISPPGAITSKQANAQYIPHIYSTMQANWLQTFYKQHSFLEYSAISEIGVSDPKQYIKRQLPNEDITFLERCAVGPKITDLVFSILNECSSNKSYVDFSTVLPSNMSLDDIKELISILIGRFQSNTFVYCGEIVFSMHYLNECIQLCNEIVNTNAKQAVESGLYQQHLIDKQLATQSSKGSESATTHVDVKLEKREERKKKAAAGKGGGGTQGRETKTKSTKKHRGGAKSTQQDDDDSDDDNESKYSKRNKILEFVSIKEIVKIITPKLDEEGLGHLSEEIANLYHQQLNQTALQVAQTLQQVNSQENRKQTHTSLQEKLNQLLVDIRLFEKGLKQFPTDVQPQLVKHLLKTLGNEICNEIALYIASECNLNIKTKQLNPDQRNKIAQECDVKYRDSLMELNKSLTKGTIEEFVTAVEVAFKSCSMTIKKMDKKKDKQSISQYKEKLCHQLQGTDDPALILHLSVLIIFTSVTGYLLCASGRFVSQILQFLQPHLNKEQISILQEFHTFVLKLLSSKEDSENISSEEKENLQRAVIDLAINYEKPGIVKCE